MNRVHELTFMNTAANSFLQMCRFYQCVPFGGHSEIEYLFTGGRVVIDSLSAIEKAVTNDTGFDHFSFDTDFVTVWLF